MIARSMIALPVTLLAASLGALLLVACDNATHEWSLAKGRDTAASYQTFVSNYPIDVHAAEARQRITRLRDDAAWAAAQIDSTVEGYDKYLEAQPDGAHAQEARVARDDVLAHRRLDAWQAAQSNGTAQSLREFLKQYPDGAEADEAHDRLRAIAGYRAEFGMAPSHRAANREREMLARRYGKHLPQLVVLKPDANTHEYLLASPPMSEKGASAACSSVKRSGRRCKVVQVAGYAVAACSPFPLTAVGSGRRDTNKNAKKAPVSYGQSPMDKATSEDGSGQRKPSAGCRHGSQRIGTQ